MNDTARFEDRLSVLIAAYADRAPTEVDSMAMARLVAAGSRRGIPISIGLVPPGRVLGYAVLVLALLMSIVAGALLSGAGPFRREPDEILTERTYVEPFVGLPPDGATPSIPTTGELVFSFVGRPYAIDQAQLMLWVYDDGRMIWTRENPVTEKVSSSGGRGLHEQRLSPYGVELLRSEVISKSTGVFEDDPGDGTNWNNPGVRWGSIRARIDDRLVELDWTDRSLPGRLATPTDWLPATAWEDQRPWGYVPSRYAVCVEDWDATGADAELEASSIAALLPEPTKELIRASARENAPVGPSLEDDRCLYQVASDDARAIVETLEDAGMPQDGYDSLRYYLETGTPNTIWVELLPVLPDGSTVCNCG